MKNFYFLAFNSAFYWVRSSVLESDVALAEGFRARKVFESSEILPQSVLCFNRFNISLYYQFLAKLAEKLSIPMIFDIDDLFWELPEHSLDFATSGSTYLTKVEGLLAKAKIITTTQDYIKNRILERYPDKKVIVVPNAKPNWQAPKQAVLIVNTDSFKFNAEDLTWFVEIFEKLLAAGVPVQLIGSNAAISQRFGLHCYSFKEVGYEKYLDILKQGDFKFGLVPVSNSEYADCKSAIKLNEFLANGIKVFASAIYPYKEFQNKYPNITDLKIVENSAEGWRVVIEEILSAYSKKSELLQATQMDAQQRIDQLEGWKSVADEVQAIYSTPCKRAYSILNFYNYCYLNILSKIISQAKFFLRPIKKLMGLFR